SGAELVGSFVAVNQICSGTGSGPTSVGACRAIGLSGSGAGAFAGAGDFDRRLRPALFCAMASRGAPARVFGCSRVVSTALIGDGVGTTSFVVTDAVGSA